MNLILFEPKELDSPISKSDRRIDHVLHTIGLKKGDSFDIGLANGPRGKALISEESETQVSLKVSFEESIPQLFPIHLICSYSRPASAGRILREMTSIGLSTMSFFVGDKCEKSYAMSKIWQNSDYHRFLREGAEQAFCTRIPAVHQETRLEDALDSVQENYSPKSQVALDNYESEYHLSQFKLAGESVAFAVGPERGWSKRERALFRSRQIAICDLGERVLRSDTACISAATLIISKLKKS